MYQEESKPDLHKNLYKGYNIAHGIHKVETTTNQLMAQWHGHMVTYYLRITSEMQWPVR